jgi:large subunit ribosomal protein L5
MKLSDKIEKIVLNVGVGKLRNLDAFEAKILPEIQSEIALITGQKPSPRPAKKSVSGFKVRSGDIVGLKATLRRSRMADFAGRLTHIVLPRVKDFRGLSEKNVDKDGNLNIGLKDQLVFPELDAAKSKVHFGLQITFVAKSRNREAMLDFYKSFGLPFRKK